MVCMEQRGSGVMRIIRLANGLIMASQAHMTRLTATAASYEAAAGKCGRAGQKLAVPPPVEMRKGEAGTRRPDGTRWNGIGMGARQSGSPRDLPPTTPADWRQPVIQHHAEYSRPCGTASILPTHHSPTALAHTIVCVAQIRPP